MSPLTSLDLWPKNSDPKPSIPSFTLTPKTSIPSYPSGFDKDWILEEIMALLSLAFGFVFLINLPFSISPINLSLLRSHPQMWLSDGSLDELIPTLSFWFIKSLEFPYLFLIFWQFFFLTSFYLINIFKNSNHRFQQYTGIWLSTFLSLWHNHYS